VSSLLLSLRLAPLLSFTPPFTLTRLPRTFRMLLSVGLGATLAGSNPTAQLAGPLDAANIVPATAHELLIGLSMALPLHLLYASLYTAGRTVDIQAGYGLALLIDPSSQAQTPLIGTILAYLAGAVFFAANGQDDILRIIAASLAVAPIGMSHGVVAVSSVAEQLTLMLTLAFGVVGAVILTLFVIDVVIAVLARTVPQLNALIIGIQVKSIALLAVLPVSLGLAGALLARMVALTLDAIARFT